MKNINYSLWTYPIIFEKDSLKGISLKADLKEKAEEIKKAVEESVNKKWKVVDNKKDKL